MLVRIMFLFKRDKPGKAAAKSGMAAREKNNGIFPYA